MKWWITYLFLLLTQTLQAAEAVQLSGHSPYALGRQVSWIEVTPDDPAWHEERPGPWMSERPQHTGTADVLNFSFTRSRFWFTFQLANPFPEPRTVVLETASAWLDSVQLFTGPDFQDEKKAGDLLPRRLWSETFRYPAFTVTLNAGETRTIWLSVHSLDNMIIPLNLWNQSQYLTWDRERNLNFGLYYGLLITICLLNAAMYIFSRKPGFLYYTLYITSYACLQMDLDGYLPVTAQFLPPWLINHLYGALNFTTLGFAGQFTLTFLETKTYAPKLARFIELSCKGFFLAGLLFFISPYYGLAIQFSLLTTIVYAPLVMVCAAKALKAQRRSAIFFSIAWTPLILSILVLGVAAFGWMPSTIYTRSLIYFGIALEFIILSIGLGDQLARSIRNHALMLNNLEAAEAVQKALIPEMPAIPGFAIQSWYQSAESTGGDWYEVIQDSRNQRLYCFIGDVTGHGISSTLVTSAVAGAVHSYLEEKFLSDSSLEDTLEGLVTCINRTVHRTGVSSGRLLTMNLIGIDLQTFQGILLNAGHCHPLLIRHRKAQPLISRGSLLGLSEQLRLGRKNFQLEPGDMLFLYSDGLIHQHSESGAELKLQRVMNIGSEAGSAADLITNMKATHIAIYGARKLEDDCSFLAIEVLDHPSAQVLDRTSS